MTVADRAADWYQQWYSRNWLNAVSRGAAVEFAQALVDAGWHDGPKLTDDELELRTALAEAERPDMVALADEAMRHVERVNAVVEAAKKHERQVNGGGVTCKCEFCVAVRALREDEG